MYLPEMHRLPTCWSCSLLWMSLERVSSFGAEGRSRAPPRSRSRSRGRLSGDGGAPSAAAAEQRGMPSAAPVGMLQEVLHQRRRVLERHDRTGPLERVSQPYSTPALERHDIRSGDVPLQDVENRAGRYYWRTPQPRRAELQRQSRDGRGRPETARDIENNVDYLERDYWEHLERDHWEHYWASMGPRRQRKR